MDSAQLLRQLPLFADVPDPLLEAIAGSAARQRVAAGQAVVEAGDPGDALYVIDEGTLEVLVRTADGTAPTRVATLSPGECFGEMALLTGEPRSATVRALTDATLLRVASEDFARLVADVSVYQRLVTLLCSRLRRTDAQLEEAQWAQMALSRHLQGAHAHGGTEISGSTPAARALKESIEAAAARMGPVLLEGEAGTGKSLAASLIIAKSARAEGPVISIDCSAAGVDAASEIFGHEAGAVPGARARHLGALELCENGTVVIAEPHRLSTMVQERLVHALEQGVFRRIGGEEDLPLNARVIVTRRMEPSAAIPAVDPDLEALFSGGHIRVPALRDRRRDIPELADALIERHAQDLRRPKPELDRGATERLLSYEWPGNVEELDGVLRRAVALFADGRIEADHILIHLPSVSEEGRVDLFRVPLVSRFVRSRWYPLALQLPAAAVLALIVFECFFGPQTAENIALTLTWPIWWAALPLSFLFLGRVWCTICPFSLLSSVVQRIGCLNLPVPAFFRKTEIWPMTGLFVFLTWADEYWHYPDKPMWTGVVLASVLAGTLLFSFLFERRVWCRYLCPLGGVNGVYSTAALVELRSNTDVCAYHCRGHECVSKEADRACPMMERPLAMDTNRNCNLCMNCVKCCPHGAIHLFLRRPGAEIWQLRKPMLSAGVLSLLLAGTMLTHAYCKWVESQGRHLFNVAPATWLGLNTPEAEGGAWTVTFVAALLLSALAGCIASAISSSRERRPWSSNLAHYGLAFSVLAVFLHITLEGGELMAEGVPMLLGLLAGLVRVAPPPGGFDLFTPFFVRAAQVVLAAVATGLTVATIVYVARQRNEGPSRVGAGPHVVLASAVGILFVATLLKAPLPPPGPPPGEAPAVAGEPAGGPGPEGGAAPTEGKAPPAGGSRAATPESPQAVAPPGQAKGAVPVVAAGAPSAPPRAPAAVKTNTTSTPPKAPAPATGSARPTVALSGGGSPVSRPTTTARPKPKPAPAPARNGGGEPAPRGGTVRSVGDEAGLDQVIPTQ